MLKWLFGANEQNESKLRADIDNMIDSGINFSDMSAHTRRELQWRAIKCPNKSILNDVILMSGGYSGMDTDMLRYIRDNYSNISYIRVYAMEELAERMSTPRKPKLSDFI